MTMKRIILLLVFVCTSFPTFSEEIKELKVWHEKGKYFVSMVFSVDTTSKTIKRVLQDHENIPVLIPTVYDVQILKAPETNIQRVKMSIKDCVLFYCKNVVKTSDMFEDENGNLFTQLVPELSDMKSGESRWEFSRSSEGKLIINYYSFIEPDIWAPPLIGPEVIKSRLEEQIRMTVEKLSELAKE